MLRSPSSHLLRFLLLTSPALHARHVLAVIDELWAVEGWLVNVCESARVQALRGIAIGEPPLWIPIARLFKLAEDGVARDLHFMPVARVLRLYPLIGREGAEREREIREWGGSGEEPLTVCSVA